MLISWSHRVALISRANTGRFGAHLRPWRTVNDVPARSTGGWSANDSGPIVPAEPRRATSTDAASSLDHSLDHEATFCRLDFEDFDLAGQEANLVEFDQCFFRRATLARAVLDRPRFTDCLVENCDWANTRMVRLSMARVQLMTVRLTGAEWTAGGLRDVAFHDCRIDLGGFRFTSFRDVAFVDCNLTGADFTGADLRRAEFTGCDLSGAQFSGTNCDGARFSRCELAGIGGVTSLKGATVAAHDLVALSHAFARALGITVVDA